jgi:hypothetical protein
MPIALKKEERCQITMIDADGHRFLDLRLGVEGDAQACILEHRNVIGAIADGKRVGKVEP